MNSQLLGAVAVVLSMVVPAFADDPNKDDHDEIEGTWKVVSSEIDGKPLAAERIKDMRVVHTHKDGVHRFVFKKGDEVQAEGIVKHDEKMSPKGFDTTYTKGINKGQTIKGIYKLDDNKLTVCWDTDDPERPKDFSSKPGSGHTLRVYAREKGAGN